MDNAEPDGRRRPPEDVLPAIVPAGRFLIRTERLIDALSALDQPASPTRARNPVRVCPAGRFGSGQLPSRWPGDRGSGCGSPAVLALTLRPSEPAGARLAVCPASMLPGSVTPG